MPAIQSGLSFVESTFPDGCGCGTPKAVFRSVWDRLVKQLFGAIPPGMTPQEQIPDIGIWDGGVVLMNDTVPYTFSVLSDGEERPKQGDIIVYKGQYYVIGVVAE